MSDALGYINFEDAIAGTALGQRLETAAQKAEDDAASTGQDRAATAEDRVHTGLDKAATAADRVQTGLDKGGTASDRAQTTLDRTQTGLDRTATAADRTQTGQDKAATASDRVVTGQDKAATAGDRTQTGQDRTATAGDRVQTGQDRTATAADRVQTGQDRGAASASATGAAALVTALGVMGPAMAGFVYDFRQQRYFQEWGANRATIALALADVLAVSRPSVGGYFDAAGVYREAANNVPRIGFDPASLTARGLLLSEARTNFVPNSRGEGAVVNGQVPTGWLVSLVAGLTLTVVETGVEDGLPFVGFRLQGTQTAAGPIFLTMSPQGAGAMPIAVGDRLASSAFVRLVGNPTGLAGMAIRNRLYASNGGLNSSTAQPITPTNDRLSKNRHVLARTHTNAAQLFHNVILNVEGTVDVPLDVTFRVACPMLEKGGLAASSPILPPAGSPGASIRLADATLVPDLAKIGWNNGAHTLAARIRLAGLPVDGTLAGIWRADDGTENERFRAFVNPDGSVTVGVAIGGVVTQVTPAGTIAADTEARVAACFGDGVLRACVNGGTIAAAAPAGRPYAMNRLRLGTADLGGATNMLNGGLLDLVGRPGALAGADLQGLLG